VKLKCLDDLIKHRLSTEKVLDSDFCVFKEVYGFSLPDDVQDFFKTYYWGVFLCNLIWFFPGNNIKNRFKFFDKSKKWWLEFSEISKNNFFYLINEEDVDIIGFSNEAPNVNNIFPIASHASGHVIYLFFYKNRKSIVDLSYKIIIAMDDGPIINFNCSLLEFINNFINDVYLDVFEERIFDFIIEY